MEGSCPFAGTQFPPGFRFHPTDQELIIHYLRRKATASLPPASSIIADINLYKYNPWELPEKALFGEGEWFFFSPRDRKYPNGVRPNRSAGTGYWKATGTDKPILAVGSAQCLGVKKALVFYKGRPPKGIKTDWVMHEYRVLDAMVPSQKQKGSMRLDDWVLCRVRQRGSLLPSENEEKSEIWSPMPAFLSKAHLGNEKQQQQLLQAEKERSNHSELSVCQKASYLQPGNSEEAESAEESSVLNGSGGGGGGGGDGGCFGIQQDDNGRGQQLVSLMHGPIKTKLPFGALDELMLLQPNKRFQFSPDESDSDDQGFLEFLV